MTDKLYKVTCQGMTYSIGSSVIHGIGYVIAKDTDTAYKKLRKYLDSKDLGFSKERELFSIELIAEDAAFPDCQHRLYP